MYAIRSYYAAPVPDEPVDPADDSDEDAAHSPDEGSGQDDGR